MKTAIGASLPELLFKEFVVRSEFFPGGKSGLIKEALRAWFESHPMSPDEVARLQTPANQPVAAQ